MTNSELESPVFHFTFVCVPVRQSNLSYYILPPVAVVMLLSCQDIAGFPFSTGAAQTSSSSFSARTGASKCTASSEPKGNKTQRELTDRYQVLNNAIPKEHFFLVFLYTKYCFHNIYFTWLLCRMKKLCVYRDLDVKETVCFKLL